MRISDWSSDVCSSDLPVIQIFAETTLGDFLGQIARGGGNDADIDLDDTLAADAGEALIGQHAQDAALRRNRHVGDLVEEQGAAVRLFEHTGQIGRASCRERVCQYV